MMTCWHFLVRLREWITELLNRPKDKCKQFKRLSICPSLLDIPSVPLHKIFDVLDEYSIIKMKLVCRHFNTEVNHFLNRLRSRTSYILIITHGVHRKCERCKYNILVQNDGGSQLECLGVSRFTKNAYLSAPKDILHITTEHKCAGQTSLIQWIQDQPCATRYELFGIHCSGMDYSELNALEKSIKRKNLRARIVQLHICGTIYMKALIRILEALRPLGIALNVSEDTDFESVITDSFLNYVSSNLYSVKWNNKSENPGVWLRQWFYKFPPMFSMNQGGLMVDIPNVRGVIQAWLNGEMTFDSLQLSLDEDYRHCARDLAMDIGLPYQWFPFSLQGIQYTRVDGRKCYLLEIYTEDGKSSFWRLCDFKSTNMCTVLKCFFNSKPSRCITRCC